MIYKLQIHSIAIIKKNFSNVSQNNISKEKVKLEISSENERPR